LVLLPGTVTLPQGFVPKDAITDSSGKYLYVEDGASDDIAQFAIGTTGTLTPLSPATVSYPQLAFHVMAHMAADPRARALYAFGDGGIVQFRINANGTLTLFNPATLPAPNINVAAKDSVLTAQSDGSGTFLYAGNAAGTVSQYRINADGSLTSLTPAFVTVDPNGVFCAAVDPAGHGVYVGGYQGNFTDVRIYPCIVNSDGTLQTPLAPTDLPTNRAFGRLITEPTGHFVYGDTAHGTEFFPIQTDGTLGAMLFDSTTFIGEVTFDTSKKFAYSGASVFRVQSDGGITPFGSFFGTGGASGTIAAVPAGP